MDSHNHFETKTTFALSRLEWIAGLSACSILAMQHLSEIRWSVFIGLFVVIDLIGYVPGAIAYRRSATGDISRGLYLAYNLMHSLATWSVLLGLWIWSLGPQWALLAVPIHLFGDRALFGNSLKPFGVAFEPSTHPEFATFERRYAALTTDVPPIAEKRMTGGIDA